MPQFDLIIYFTAAENVLIAFFLLFFVVEAYFLVKLSLALKIRQKLKNHLENARYDHENTLNDHADKLSQRLTIPAADKLVRQIYILLDSLIIFYNEESK